MLLDGRLDSELPENANHNKDLRDLAQYIHQPHLPELVRQFLYSREHPHFNGPLSEVPLNECPIYTGQVQAYPSAIATYFAPSDPSGVTGMRRERIRATHSWRKGDARYDCVFVEADPELPGFQGLLVARVFLFFSLKHEGVVYPCALI